MNAADLNISGQQGQCQQARQLLFCPPLQALDRVLYEAGRRGQRAILSLSDYWGAFGAGQAGFEPYLQVPAVATACCRGCAVCVCAGQRRSGATCRPPWQNSYQTAAAVGRVGQFRAWSGRTELLCRQPLTHVLHAFLHCQTCAVGQGLPEHQRHERAGLLPRHPRPPAVQDQRLPHGQQVGA